MPDLLAHALIAYTIATVLSWRYEWLSRQYVTVAIAGAFIPDMMKMALVLPGPYVEEVIGLPFGWWGIHTLGGAVVAVLIGAVVVVPRERRRVAGLLALGAASHLLADALLIKPTGHSYAVLWPLTRYHPPTPGLYLSTQPWPMVVAGLVAIGAWAVTRRRRKRVGRD